MSNTISKLSGDSYPTQFARLGIGLGLLVVATIATKTVAPGVYTLVLERVSELNRGQQLGALMLYIGVSAMVVNALVMYFDEPEVLIDE